MTESADWVRLAQKLVASLRHRSGGKGGQMFTSWRCLGCGENQSSASTAHDRLCRKCSDKTDEILLHDFFATSATGAMRLIRAEEDIEGMSDLARESARKLTALEAQNARLRAALVAARDVAADRELFVAQGPRGFARAVAIIDAALKESP